jgi:hypothetical protein
MLYIVVTDVGLSGVLSTVYAICQTRQPLFTSRIQCFKAGLEDPSETGKFEFGIPSPNDGIDIGKVFAIAYDSEGNCQILMDGLGLLKPDKYFGVFGFFYTA